MSTLKVRDNIEVSIKNLDYHRSLIPLPSGEICFVVDKSIYDKHKKEFKRIVEKFFDDKIEENDFAYYLDYFSYPGYYLWDCVKFGSSYIEFLYPGSPDLGYNLHVDYFKEVTSGEIIDALVSLGNLEEDQISEEAVDALCELFNSYVNKLNKYSYVGEKAILEYIDELKMEIKEEMLRELDEDDD